MAAMASAQARPPTQDDAARGISPRDRLIVGLDLPSVEEAEAMVKRLGETVTFYKIGMELTHAGGLELAERLLGKARASSSISSCTTSPTPSSARRASSRGSARAFSLSMPIRKP
jgi:hypothetical protein